MRRFLALLLLPSAVSAFDLAEDDTRHLSDPAYLPFAGQVAADLDYQRSIQRINFPGQFASEANEVERIQSNRGALAVAFGITDRLSADVALRYGEGADKLQVSSFPYRFGPVPAQQFSAKFAKVEDPSFGAAYRLIDQAGTGVNLDLHAAYSPYLARRVFNYFPYVQTDARGRQAFDAHLSLSRVMQSLTMAMEIGERHESGGGAFRHDDLGIQPAIPLGPQDTVDAALKTQVRILDRLALDAAFAVAKPSALTYRESPYIPGDKVKYDAVTSARFGLDYFLIPDSLYVGPWLDFVSGGPARDRVGYYLQSEIRSPFEKSFGVRLGFAL